jgi:hypothetical protein
MIYVLCEESKSGYKYWTEWCKNFINNPYNCATTKGVSNMYKEIKNLSLTSNDIVILFIDYTQTQLFSDIFVDIMLFIGMIGATTFFTEYYCFESWLLTFEDLVSWSQCKNANNIKLRDNVYAAIRGGKEIRIEEIPFLVSSTETNIEFYCSQLLNANRKPWTVFSEKGKAWDMLV